MPRWSKVLARATAVLLACVAPGGCTSTDVTVRLTPPAPADRDAMAMQLSAVRSPCVALGARVYDPLHPAVYVYAVRAAHVMYALASAPADPTIPRCLDAGGGMALFAPLGSQARYLLQLVVLDEVDAAATQIDPTRSRIVAAVDFPPSNVGPAVCVNSPRLARPNGDILAAAAARCNDLASQGSLVDTCVLTFDDASCGQGTP